MADLNSSKNPLVLILAAGKGTRMGPLGLSLNKVMFPLGNQAVLSKIFSQFPVESEFVIAVNYHQEQIKKFVQIAHPNQNVQYASVDRISGAGAGPAYSCLQARPFLKRAFFLVCGDTLWTDKIPTTNTESWLGVSEVSEDEAPRFCMIGFNKSQDIERILDKAPSGHQKGDMAFNGLAFIQDVDAFFNSISKGLSKTGETQLSAGFEGILTSSKLGGHKMPGWSDVGTLDGYYDYLKKNNLGIFLKTKNTTYLIDDKVIKYIPDKNECQNRIKRASLLSNVGPKNVRGEDQFLWYQMVPGDDFYTKGSLEKFSELLKWSKQNLWTIVRNDDVLGLKMKDFLAAQKESRLSEYRKINPDCMKPVLLNKTISLDPVEILSKITWDLGYSGRATSFHGDFHFANVIVPKTKDKTEFCLIDWRESLAGEIDQADIIYDLAKLNLGIEFRLDARSMSQVTFEKNGENVTVSEAQSIHDKNLYQRELYKFAEEIGISQDRIKLVSALLAINMAGIHDSRISNWAWYVGLSMLKALQ